MVFFEEVPLPADLGVFTCEGEGGEIVQVNDD